MDADFLYKLKMVEDTNRLFGHMSIKAVEEAVGRIRLLSDFIEKHGDFADLVKDVAEIKQKIYVCRDMLTVDEAADYLGVTVGKLYKMTSRREITFYKPRGKLLYFERKDLDELLRTNPCYSTSEQERRAIIAAMTEEKKSPATRNRKKGGNK